MKISELPTLKVVSIDGLSIIGEYTNERWIGEEHIVCMLVDECRFVWGRLTEIDTTNSTCRFTPEDPNNISAFRTDEEYHRLDGYWGGRAELVLDGSMEWQERRFEAPDAVWFEHSRTMRPYEGEIPPGGTLIAGGWDHEHCEICGDTISSQTNPVGMFAEPNWWLCLNCFEKYVRQRSLDFIIEGQ